MGERFYEVEIQVNNEGTESKAIYSYDTRDQAVAVFHQKMASGITAGLAGNLASVLNLVINEYGNTVIMERWVAPAPEPEVPEE